MRFCVIFFSPVWLQLGAFLCYSSQAASSLQQVDKPLPYWYPLTPATPFTCSSFCSCEIFLPCFSISWLWVSALCLDGSADGEGEFANVDWDNLGFGIMPTDYMFTMRCSKDGCFEQGQLTRYGNIELSPSAGVLNYGQASSNLQVHLSSFQKLFKILGTYFVAA